MANDPIFDGNVPSPAPIQLTFGEDGSASIAADTAQPKTDPVIEQAQAAARQAQSVIESQAAASAFQPQTPGQQPYVQAPQQPAYAQAPQQQAYAQPPQQQAYAQAPQAQAYAQPPQQQAYAQAPQAQAQTQEAKVENIRFTPEEQKMVDDFSQRIDIHDSKAVMNYGAGTQKKMSDFTDQALANVRNKDLGEVGAMISGLVTELQDFDVEEDDKGFFKFFKKQGNKMVALKARYDKTEASVNTIVEALENHQVQLLKDVATLDQMYALNLAYFKELSMYIAAGKKRLAEVREGELKQLQDKAAATGDAQDAQEAKDLGALCDRFEKKLHDLELTRMIALQTGPQIRLVQDSDTLMAEKIQSTIVNTIPLWKNQMVIAMGVEHSNQAAKAQHEVSELTNALLKKNAEQLHTASVETAKESERGIVDIETLKQTNQELITTLDEVLRIQEEGRAKRAEAENEMARMEGELKEKLLELSRTSR